MIGFLSLQRERDLLLLRFSIVCWWMTFSSSDGHFIGWRLRLPLSITSSFGRGYCRVYQFRSGFTQLESLKEVVDRGKGGD